MHIQVFADPIIFHIGDIPVTDAMLTTTAVAIVLLVLASRMRRSALRDRRSTAFALATWIVEWWDSTVTDIVGKPSPLVSNITGSLLVFIAISNIAGQFPGVHPATGTVTTTAALAVLVFVAVPMIGVYTRGFRGYVEHYFQPYPIMAPLHLVSELSRTLALCMRLFGNVMSGHLVVFMLIALAGLFVPVPLMALDLLIGVLQAYIFAVLAAVYLGAAIEVDEDATKIENRRNVDA